MANKTAIVIGGGVAGASAAFRLAEAGVQVKLIERDAQVGGRTRALRIDGFIADVAAGLMPGSYSAVFSLMHDAGLRDMLEPMTSPTAVLRDGQMHYLDLTHPLRAILSTRLLGFRSKLKLASVGIRGLRMWSKLGFDDIVGAAPFDTESIHDYAKRALNEELYDYLINPTEKLMYTLPGDEASVLDFFWCAKNLFHPRAFCVKGGMDQIVKEVSKQFHVVTDTEATRVEDMEHCVRVTTRTAGRERTETVDFCVIATPARDVPSIDTGLSPPSRRFLETLRYSVLTDLHLRLKSRPAEKAVLIMVPDNIDPEIAGILVDHNKGADRAPTGKGALSVYFIDRWARFNYEHGDAEIFQRGMAKVERVWPGIGALVEGYHVQRWDYAATASYPGYYQELATFVAGLNLHRRVQLAGDYFSLASLNTAVTSGALAAKRLLQDYL